MMKHLLAATMLLPAALIAQSGPSTPKCPAGTIAKPLAADPTAKDNKTPRGVICIGPRGTREAEPASGNPAMPPQEGKAESSAAPAEVLSMMASSGREDQSPVQLLAATRLAASITGSSGKPLPVDIRPVRLLEDSYKLASSQRNKNVLMAIAGLLADDKSGLGDPARAVTVRKEADALPGETPAAARQTRDTFFTRNFNGWTALDKKSRLVYLQENIAKGTSTFLYFYIDEPSITKAALTLTVLFQGFNACGWIRSMEWNGRDWNYGAWTGWNGAAGSQVAVKVPKGPGYYGVQVFASQPTQGAQVTLW